MQSEVWRQHCLGVTRRHFFRECGVGLGKMALASLLTGRLVGAGANSAVATGPLAARAPHFPAKAKRVIHLFMAGAPSQLDMFDFKPKLADLEGQPLPESVVGGQRYAFIRPDAAVLGPQYRFARHGQSGAEISEILPHLAGVVDDLCIIKSIHTDQFNHAPAQIFFNTGFGQPGRPSLALFGIARNNNPRSRRRTHHTLWQVESQFGFARPLVRAVAFEAVPR